MNQSIIFARLAKYDEQTGAFEALASDQSIDKTKERMHYDTSKPHFLAWSGEFAKATDGKSVGNVRSMHGKNACGKLTMLECNDAEKAIFVRGVIVDENDRKKMASGVYTGVSIGGSYEKMWDDESNPGVKWFTAVPCEVSLVDNPCNPNARFKMHKADGSDVDVDLVGDPEAVAARQADEAEKAAVNELAKMFDGGAIKPSDVVKYLKGETDKKDAANLESRRADLKKALVDENITIGQLEKLAVDWLPEDKRGGDVQSLLKALFEVGGFTPEELGKLEIAEDILSLSKVSSDAAQIAAHVRFDPTYSAIASDAKQSSDFAGGVVVVNMKRFPEGKQAKSALASLLLKKGVVVIDSDSIFPSESGIPSHADFFGVSAPALGVLFRSRALAGTAFGASVPAVAKGELLGRLEKTTNSTNPVAFILSGRPSEDALTLVHVPVDQKTLVMKGAQPTSFDADKVAAAFNSAFLSGNVIHKKDFTDKERERLAESGAAMKDGSYPIRNKSDLSNAIQAIGRAKNPAAVKRHIKRRAAALGATDAIPDSWKDVSESGLAKSLESFQKGLGSIGWLARLLEELISLSDACEYEQMMEGDTASVLPGRLSMACNELGEILCEMCEEETQEEAEKAATKDALHKAFEKYGARHSAADKGRLQGIHDHSVAMGAECAKGDKSAPADMRKILGLGADADGAAVEKQMRSVIEKARKWDEQPVRKGTLRAVTKGAEIVIEETPSKEDAEVEKMQRASESGDLMAQIKLSLRGITPRKPKE